MTKRILTFALAGAAAMSMFAFGPKRALPLGDKFAGSVEAKGIEKIVTRAGDENSLDFTLADEVYTATGLQNMKAGTVMYLAFEFSEENTNVFAGDSITSINIVTGAVNNNGKPAPNQVKDITLFIKDDLSGETLYSQEGTLGSDPFTLNKIPLDKAFKIEAGKPFFVGYTFALPIATQYPIAIDYVPTENMEGCWVGFEENGKVQWRNYADQMGNICMGCTITGEKMPENRVDIIEYAGPALVQPGVPFKYQVLVKNLGKSAVKKIEVAYKVGSGEVQTASFDVGNDFVYNTYGQFALDDIVCNEPGIAIPLTISVTKVNGVDNTGSNKEVKIELNSITAADGFKRIFLVEEATGTWCAWCPGGIVVLEYIREKYPDMFALAAIHSSNGSQIDRMQVASTAEWRQTYAHSFPMAFIDRETSVIVSNNAAPNKQVIDDFVKEHKEQPGLMGFGDITYSVDDQSVMTVTTTVKTAYDMQNNDRYRLSYYIVQDGVGPYNQNNGYAASGYVNDGWEKKPRTVSTIYDDVVRYMIGGAKGVSNSLPAEMKKGEDATYTTTIPLTAVTSRAFRLIAFIVDTKTGNIVNATKIEAENPNISGIGSVTVDSQVVSRRYYNLSGVEVSEPSNGIFVERSVYSDGTVKSAKVVKK